MFKRKLFWCFLTLFLTFNANLLMGMSASAASSEDTAQIEISPALFGLNDKTNKNEYIQALRDLTQLLYYHHEYSEFSQSIMNNYRRFETNQQDAVAKLLAWQRLFHFESLEQKLSEGSDPEQVLQQIKRAIATGEEHPLLIRTQFGKPLFAHSPQGIALLLKYRSLFFKQSFAKQERLLIDRLFQEKLKTGNDEEQLLISHLKNHLDYCLAFQAPTEKQIRKHDILNTKIVECIKIFQKYHCTDNLTEEITLVAHSQITIVHILSRLFQPAQGVQAILLKQQYLQLKGALMHQKTKYKELKIASLYERVTKELHLQIFKLRQKQNLSQYKRSIFNEDLPVRLVEESEKNTEAKSSASAKDQKKEIPKPKTSRKNKKSKTSKHTKTQLSSVKNAKPPEIDIPKIQPDSEIASANIPNNQNKDIVSDDNDNTAMPLQQADNNDLSLIAYIDGTRQESDAKIVIEDPSNQMTITLFPTDAHDKRFYDKVIFKENIQRWFKDVQGALAIQRAHVNDNQFDSEIAKNNNKIRIHRFSKHVDRYIEKMGVVSQLKDGHRDGESIVVIPGNVKYQEEQEPRTCYFVYFIDKDNKCFHRNIEFKLHYTMLSEFLAKGFFEVEFPPLS
jgi:hypothetical protein